MAWIVRMRLVEDRTDNAEAGSPVAGKLFTEDRCAHIVVLLT